MSNLCLTLLLSLLVASLAHAKVETTSFSVLTTDGLTLQGRLDAPSGAKKLPVIILLQGAGPLNVDMALVEPNNPSARCYSGWQNDCRIDKHLAAKLADQGYAVVRLGKRGTWVDEINPNHVRVNYQENSTSTLSARMKDFEALLDQIAAFPSVDSESIHLIGVSEGSMIAQKAMSLLGQRLKSMTLVGAVLASGIDLYRGQVVDSAFDLLLRVADRDHDGLVSRAEFGLETLRLPPPNYDHFSPAFFRTLKDFEQLGVTPTFQYFDANRDGVLVRSEIQERVHRELFLRILEAVQSGDPAKLAAIPDDDYSYNYNTLSQFSEWFAEPSKAQELARARFDVTILFGSDDFNTSPRQLDWFLPLAWSERNSRVIARTVPNESHYGPKLAEEVISIFRRQ